MRCRDLVIERVQRRELLGGGRAAIGLSREPLDEFLLALVGPEVTTAPRDDVGMVLRPRGILLGDL